MGQDFNDDDDSFGRYFRWKQVITDRYIFKNKGSLLGTVFFGGRLLRFASIFDLQLSDILNNMLSFSANLHKWNVNLSIKYELVTARIHGWEILFTTNWTLIPRLGWIAISSVLAGPIWNPRTEEKINIQWYLESENPNKNQVVSCQNITSFFSVEPKDVHCTLLVIVYL